MIIGRCTVLGKERADVERHLFQYSCRKATPLVFVKGDCVGSVADLEKLNSKGVIQEWLKDHEFDLVVIGGGSGGLAAAQVGYSLWGRTQ